MWIKIISVISLLLQVVFQLLQTMAQNKLRAQGKAELEQENEGIVKDMADEADKIRASADELDDNLLLKPAARGAGGLPGVSADLSGDSSGGESSGETAGGAKDRGAQFYMGKELSPFEFTIPKRKVVKVFIHCSASDRAEDDNVKTINQWHLARGWVGIGYNYYIDKQGRILTGRDIAKIPAAQHGFNTGSIAICCGGKNFFTPAQFLSLENMCKVIANEYLQIGVTISFHGHCEVSSKTCPNFDYKSILGLDDNGYII